nr:hypothetical protein [Methylobacter tundripaludum]
MDAATKHRYYLYTRNKNPAASTQFRSILPCKPSPFLPWRRKKDSSGLALYCRNSPIKSLTAQVVREINTEDHFIEAQLGDLTLSRFTYLSARQRRRPTSLQG